MPDPRRTTTRRWPGLSDTRASAVIVDLSYPEYLSAFYALEDMLRGNGQWFNPHPWWLTFLPDSAAESLATEILDQVAKTASARLVRLLITR